MLRARRCRRPPAPAVQELTRLRRLGLVDIRMSTPRARALRRSSSDMPPQIPDSWLVNTANSRHLSVTAQALQITLAAWICSRAEPVVPTGKNRSASELRHAARALQAPPSQSCVRSQVKATVLPQHSSEPTVATGCAPSTCRHAHDRFRSRPYEDRITAANMESMRKAGKVLATCEQRHNFRVWMTTGCAIGSKLSR
jgi:hypothetical protein